VGKLYLIAGGKVLGILQVPNVLGSHFLTCFFAMIWQIIHNVCKLWESLILTVRTVVCSDGK